MPWWPPERSRVTLHTILVHVVAETDPHAGHADIVRELVDRQAGLRREVSNLPDDYDLGRHRDRVEADARDAAARPG